MPQLADRARDCVELELPTGGERVWDPAPDRTSGLLGTLRTMRANG